MSDFVNPDSRGAASPPIIQVDAFASRPFEGNPAAVCLLDRPARVSWMARVAREMNLSETAFVVPAPGGSATTVVFGLRWFTPIVEVYLCGHATLAAAHALWERGVVAPERSIRFETRSGPLQALRRPDGAIRLDFPALPIGRPQAPSEGLERMLGVPIAQAITSGMDWLIELESETDVTELRPDLTALATLPARGIIVTARAAEPESCGYDFVSRFFAPAVGVPEDPVTGSAHCRLAPFWADRLGRRQLIGRQLSARGGTVGVELEGERVGLVGYAVTVFRAELLVPVELADGEGGEGFDFPVPGAVASS
mgnify:CR=1 FL=1